MYKLGTVFLTHHFYVLSLTALCPIVEKKTLKEIIHLCYMANMANPTCITGTPAHWVLQFKILVKAFLLIITIYLVCLLDALE